MNKELETLINNLEGCIGMFDYMLTPIENNLLLSYINELQQENEKLNHYKKLYQILKREKEELRSWLEDGFGYDKGVVAEEYIEAIENVLDKLNELEEGKNENTV